MAITFTVKDSAEGFTGGPITSNSVALAGNTIMRVTCHGFSTVSAAPTATGLTFSLIVNQDDGTRGVYVYHALISGAGFSGTVQMFGGSDFMVLYEISEVAGCLITGTNGADAIVPTNTITLDQTSPATLTYPNAFSQPTNAGYAAYSILPGSTDWHPMTPRAGWSTLAGGLQANITIGRTSGDTAADIAVTGGGPEFTAVALEYADAGSGPPLVNPFILRSSRLSPKRTTWR